MRTYEGLFLLDPTKATQDWEGIKKQIIGMLERRNATIISAKKWAERKLAYEIKGHKRGVYLLIYFQMPAENVNVVRRDIQLSETVLRNLIIVHQKPLTKEMLDKIVSPDVAEKIGDNSAEDTAKN